MLDHKLNIKVSHIITRLNDGCAEAVLYRICKYDQANHHHFVSLTGIGKYDPCWKRLAYLLPSFDLPPPSRTKVLAKLSWWLPAKVVICAQRAKEVHEALGYDRSKIRFIPNGYDLADFQPGLDAQGDMKASLEPDQSILLIGAVGRFDPQKDHANLLDALAILRDRGLAFRCVLVGTGLDSPNPQIVEQIVQCGFGGRIFECAQCVGYYFLSGLFLQRERRNAFIGITMVPSLIDLILRFGRRDLGFSTV